VARHAQCFQILEVVNAAERPVRAESRTAVIDLEAILRLPRAPFPHRRLIGAFVREADPGGTLGGNVSAPAAAILVAPFGGAARLRPPVVVPKSVAAAIAAPRAAARRQRFTAPRAAARARARKRADRQERGALRCFYRNAGLRSASSCGEASPARKSGSAAIENCIPVQKCPNSPKRDDASSNRIS
jgi:hypothetical protein